MSNCLSCKFYLPVSDDQGLCRRYPPTAQVIPMPKTNLMAGRNEMQLQTASNFPPVSGEGWCGEHADPDAWRYGEPAR